MYRQNSNDGCDSSQDCLYHRLRQEKMQIRRSQSFQQFQASTSTSGLQSISESVNESSDSEIDEDDEQAFESCSQSSLSWANCSRPTSYSSEMQDPAATPTFAEDKINTKEYCLLNNTVKPRARSTSQLNLITNDLSRTGSADCTSKRLSVMSDSVLLMHHHHLPELYSLSKEQQHEL